MIEKNPYKKLSCYLLMLFDSQKSTKSLMYSFLFDSSTTKYHSSSINKSKFLLIDMNKLTCSVLKLGSILVDPFLIINVDSKGHAQFFDFLVSHIVFRRSSFNSWFRRIILKHFQWFINLPIVVFKVIKCKNVVLL